MASRRSTPETETRGLQDAHSTETGRCSVHGSISVYEVCTVVSEYLGNFLSDFLPDPDGTSKSSPFLQPIQGPSNLGVHTSVLAIFRVVAKTAIVTANRNVSPVQRGGRRRNLTPRLLRPGWLCSPAVIQARSTSDLLLVMVSGLPVQQAFGRLGGAP